MTRNAKSEQPSFFLRFGKAANQARLRLYCFAHAGGTAAIYAPWARLLAPDIEVCAVEFAGHGTRMGEEPLKDVKAIVDDVLPHLHATQADQKPFSFYGHSLGAVVAFEVAHALEDLNYIAKHAVGVHLGPWSSMVLQHLFLGAARAPHIASLLQPISQLNDDAFLAGVQQRYGGISDAVLAEPELLEMILPPMRADFTAYESYRPRTRRPLACPLTAFAGTLDPVVTPEGVAAWADHTSGPFRFHAIPGDHFFMGEHREQVLGLLSRALRNESAPDRPGSVSQAMLPM